jgi:sigma54-dependent transcription regulator
VINCSGPAATLIEGEMFGHIKVAFTGAERDRIGKLAGAGRGTLLSMTSTVYRLTCKPNSRALSRTGLS